MYNTSICLSQMHKTTNVLLAHFYICIYINNIHNYINLKHIHFFIEYKGLSKSSDTILFIKSEQMKKSRSLLTTIHAYIFPDSDCFIGQGIPHIPFQSSLQTGSEPVIVTQPAKKVAEFFNSLYKLYP